MTTPPMALPAIDVPPPRNVTGAPRSSGQRDGCGQVVDVGRHDHEVGDDAVVGRIGGVERPRLPASSRTAARAKLAVRSVSRASLPSTSYAPHVNIVDNPPISVTISQGE